MYIVQPYCTMNRASINPALLILACICLFLVAISNILVLCSMAKNISDHSQDFYPGSPLFWWGIGYRVILNGLGTYSTWTVVASLLNLATALVYAGEVRGNTRCLKLDLVSCRWTRGMQPWQLWDFWSSAMPPGLWLKIL